MEPAKLIQLDRRIPFVKAAFDLIEGRGMLDPVAGILRVAERRHGVRWIHDDGGGPYCLFKPLDGNKKYSGERLKRALTGHMSEEYAPAILDPSSVGQDAGPFRTIEAGEIEDHERRLRGLLTECGLVFQGASLVQRVFVAYDDGGIEGWSNRNWGQFMADWANSVSWHSSRSWSYSIFAFNLYTMVEEYKAWERVISEAIQMNCEDLK